LATDGGRLRSRAEASSPVRVLRPIKREELDWLPVHADEKEEALEALEKY